MSGVSNFLSKVTFGFFLLFAASACGQTTEQDAQSGPEGRMVAITVTHPKLDDVQFLVPDDYLGPKFLNLSQKNRRGGKHKSFLVEFYYPSMAPNIPENGYLVDEESLTYASVNTGLSRATRRYATDAKTGEIDASMFVETGETLCDMRVARNDKIPLAERKYFRSDKDYERMKKNAERHAYYYRDADNEDNDVFIDCNNLNCRYYIEYPLNSIEGGSYYIRLNGIPKDRLCDWRNLKSRIQQLTDSFMVKGD